MQSWYLVFVGTFGYTPSEFWKLAPGELWWVLEAKLPPKKEQISQRDWEKFYNDLD